VKLRMILACCAALALTVGVATATAGNGKGGNSANAKLCQKGGWTTLYRSDGTTFANQDECVSYGANGGTILTAPPKTQSQLDCESFGGTYSTVPSTDQTGDLGFGVIPIVLWTCNGIDVIGVGAQPTLQNDCFDNGGAIFQWAAGLYSTCGRFS
jgi:hypothetical protein